MGSIREKYKGYLTLKPFGLDADDQKSAIIIRNSEFNFDKPFLRKVTMNDGEQDKLRDKYKEIELKYKRFDVFARGIGAFAAIASAIAAFLAIRGYTGSPTSTSPPCLLHLLYHLQHFLLLLKPRLQPLH